MSQKSLSALVNTNIQHQRQMYVDRIDVIYKECKLCFLDVYVLTLKRKIMV